MSDRAVPFFLIALLFSPSGTTLQARDVWFDTTPDEQKGLEALDELTEVELFDARLSEALKLLATQHDIRYRIGPRAHRKLSTAPRDRYPISVVLSGITLRSTLKILLRDLGLDHYIDKEGTIVAVTVEEKLSRIVTRRYDVSRLLKPNASAETLVAALRRLAAEHPQSAKPRIGGFGNTLVVRANDSGQNDIVHLLTLIDTALNKEQYNTAREKLLAALDEKTNLRVRDKPLSDVLNQLARAHNVNIWLNPRKTEEGGVSAQHSVSVTLNDVRLHEVLDAVLAPLKLGYIVEDEVLMVTNGGRAAESTFVRAVNIASLLGANASASELRKAIIDSSTEPLTAVVVFRNVVIARGKPAAHLQFIETLDLLGRQSGVPVP
jgi:hypothetical protein